MMAHDFVLLCNEVMGLSKRLVDHICPVLEAKGNGSYISRYQVLSNERRRHIQLAVQCLFQPLSVHSQSVPRINSPVAYRYINPPQNHSEFFSQDEPGNDGENDPPVRIC